MFPQGDYRAVLDLEGRGASAGSPAFSSVFALAGPAPPMAAVGQKHQQGDQKKQAFHWQSLHR
jgi:hypothetical protein